MKRRWILVFLLAFIPLLTAAGPHNNFIKSKNPIVRMETNYGDIIIELFQDEAPITVENFLTYVNNDFYNDTVFHRVIDGFMIQGGGFKLSPPNEEGYRSLVQKNTLEAIKNEAENGLQNRRGTIAMARTRVIDSATSQFFINVTDNPSLDFRSKSRTGYGYAVFGKVIEGMKVVDKIKVVPTNRNGLHQNVPKKPVVIRRITRLR